MERFVNIEPPPAGVIYEDHDPSSATTTRLHQRKPNSMGPRKSMEKVIKQYDDEEDDDLED
jgi:hypothetical protein